MNVMSYKGYKACIMEAERLIGDGIFQLPPGNPLNIYYANQFDAYPEDWVKEGAFVVPVKPEKGLWFDFRGNNYYNTAILMSVKGCNPITGQQLSGFHLDKYEKRCPVHNCDFIGERYCKECGYKWPDRSYLSGNPLWWDGWMTEGVIRQFFFTKDMMRDVATLRIGKKNIVPAFGFAFYSAKKGREGTNILRSNTKYSTKSSSNISPPSFTTKSASFFSKCAPQADLLCSSPIVAGQSISDTSYSCLDEVSEKFYSCNSINIIEKSKEKPFHSISDKKRLIKRKSEIRVEEVEEKESVSIGAGAKIAQELPLDPDGVDTWKDTPDSVMTIYFMFQKEFDELVSKGFHDIDKPNKGILEGIPVG